MFILTVLYSLKRPSLLRLKTVYNLKSHLFDCIKDINQQLEAQALEAEQEYQTMQEEVKWIPHVYIPDEKFSLAKSQSEKWAFQRSNKET